MTSMKTELDVLLREDLPKKRFVYVPKEGQLQIPASEVAELIHKIPRRKICKKNFVDDCSHEVSYEEIRKTVSKNLARKIANRKLDIQRDKSLRERAFGKKQEPVGAVNSAEAEDLNSEKVSHNKEKFEAMMYLKSYNAHQRYLKQKFPAVIAGHHEHKTVEMSKNLPTLLVLLSLPNDERRRQISDGFAKIVLTLSTASKALGRLQDLLMRTRLEKHWEGNKRARTLKAFQRAVRYVVTYRLESRRRLAGLKIVGFFRRCLLRARARAKLDATALIRRYLQDHKNHINFTEVLLRYRARVLRCQRLVRDFLECKRARLFTLLLLGCQLGIEYNDHISSSNSMWMQWVEALMAYLAKRRKLHIAALDSLKERIRYKEPNFRLINSSDAKHYLADGDSNNYNPQIFGENDNPPLPVFKLFGNAEVAADLIKLSKKIHFRPPKLISTISGITPALETNFQVQTLLSQGQKTNTSSEPLGGDAFSSLRPFRRSSFSIRGPGGVEPSNVNIHWLNFSNNHIGATRSHHHFQQHHSHHSDHIHQQHMHHAPHSSYPEAYLSAGNAVTVSVQNNNCYSTISSVTRSDALAAEPMSVSAKGVPMHDITAVRPPCSPIRRSKNSRREQWVRHVFQHLPIGWTAETASVTEQAFEDVEEFLKKGKRPQAPAVYRSHRHIARRPMSASKR